MSLQVLSLFSGIGGLDLGLERAGMKIVAHSEIDPYCCQVLKRHWPMVPNIGDITKITSWGSPPEDWKFAQDWVWAETESDVLWIQKPNVIAGGFPCQDISSQGNKRGIKDGDRSGLWRYFLKTIRFLRPSYVIVENVAALRHKGRGLDIVLGDLASLGYDAEWDCIPAKAFGAPHQRDRIFIIAYPIGERQSEPWQLPGSLDPEEDPYREATDVVNAFQGGSLPYMCRRHDGIPPGLGKQMLTALGNAVVPQVGEHIGRIVLDRHA